MRQAIEEALGRVEEAEHLRVLYAVESGSRAWGFASRNSDWDVRFIYIRHPDWYLSVQRRRDVLEYPLDGDLDVSGWDLKKALGLFAKSNPPLLEWLRSPLVYREAFSVMETLRTLSARYFSSRSCMHHYFHMAEGNYREYLQGDSVRVKKYFYVLRPVLACKWVAAHGTMPPMEFASLAEDQLPSTLQPVVHALLNASARATSSHLGPASPSSTSSSMRKWLSSAMHWRPFLASSSLIGRRWTGCFEKPCARYGAGSSKVGAEAGRAHPPVLHGWRAWRVPRFRRCTRGSIPGCGLDRRSPPLASRAKPASWASST